jgi:serine/threonine protein kinase
MKTFQGSHPDTRDLIAYAEGRLAAAEAAAIATHTEQCPACRALVEQGGKVADPSGLPETTPDIPQELASHPRYKVLQRLGAGGMGTVYLAEHLRLGRPVALMVKRFLTEITAVARLDHENIVRAHDADEAGGLHFLVMEYVEGVSLASYLDQKGALPVRVACTLARQVALGLQHAHSQSPPIIHRDIKPGNLLLTRKGKVKIADFGLARLGLKVPGMGLTRTGVGMGTPEYMPPEQARDASRADARSDIYSLGVVLYEMLAGRRPFAESNTFDLMLAHVQREPAPLHGPDSQVPEQLSGIVARMLAKDPGQRYQTAEEVAQALLPFCKGGQQPGPNPGPKVGDTITGVLGMKFAWVPPGKSWLGGGGGKPGTKECTLPKGLWCGVYPVTQAEWQAVMGSNPSAFGGNPRHPVENVSWDDVQQFLAKLKAQNPRGGLLYRLPTEEEWEYSCRGGPLSKPQSSYHFYFARSRTDLTAAPTNDLSSHQANFGGTLQRTSEVGLYLPNPLGIHDLHGNVWEWTSSSERP